MKRCKLIPPPADPQFFATEVAALAAIEKEASEKIYTLLLEAKSKHLKLLHTAAHPSLFTARTLAAHAEFVREYATDANALYVSASQSAAAAASASAFPIADAIAHFESHLHAEVAAVTSLTLEQRRAAREQKAAAQAAELKAQETVLGGAHTGETIRSIAVKAVHSEMTGSHRLIHPHPRRITLHTGTTTTEQPRKPHRPRHTPRRSRTPHLTPLAPRNRSVRGRRRRMSFASPRMSKETAAESNSHARTLAILRTTGNHPSSHPKNAKGGDRSSRPRQPQAAALQGKRKHEGAGGNMSDTANMQHQQPQHHHRKRR